MNNFKKNNAGFTIVEVVIAVAVTLVLIVPIAYLSITVLSGPKQQYAALDNVDNARITASRFVNEIRSAVNGVDGSAPVSLANGTEIIIHSPAGGDGVSIKRIRYYISENALYKGVVVPSGTPLTYVLSEETTTKILPDLMLGEESLFYYYDGEYDGDTAPLSPVNINDIRFVKINLIVLKQTTQGGNNTFSLNVGASIRSLKDNLGD